jgi:hypothetical protein
MEYYVNGLVMKKKKNDPFYILVIREKVKFFSKNPSFSKIKLGWIGETKFATSYPNFFEFGSQRKHLGYDEITNIRRLLRGGRYFTP